MKSAAAFCEIIPGTFTKLGYREESHRYLDVQAVPLTIGGHELLQCSCSLYLELGCVPTCILHLDNGALQIWPAKHNLKIVIKSMTLLAGWKQLFMIEKSANTTVHLQVEVLVSFLDSKWFAFLLHHALCQMILKIAKVGFSFLSHAGWYTSTLTDDCQRVLVFHVLTLFST